MNSSFDNYVGSPRFDSNFFRGSFPGDQWFRGSRERAGNGDIGGAKRKDLSKNTTGEYKGNPNQRDWDKELPPEKEPKTMKGQFVRFSEHTSLMGVPFLNRATRWYAKVFWVAILIFAFSYMIHQVYTICATYYAFNTTTSVSIGFETLDFPSVTICNENPIRSSYLEWLDEDLQEFLSAIEPEKDFTSDMPPAPSTGRPPLESQGRKRRASGAGPNIEPGGPGAAGGATSPGGSEPTTPNNGEDSLMGPIGDNPPHQPQNDASKRHRIRGDLPSKFQTEEEIFGDEEEDNDEEEIYGGGQISTDLKVKTVFKTLYTHESRSMREEVGHQAGTMIVQCSFNGRECIQDNFTHTLSSDYGNCYTFNDVKNVNQSRVLKSRRSGAEYGFQLVLFVEEFEYIKGLTEGLGARIAIHPFNTMTFIHSNGLSVAPGFQTNIGLKMINMTRLGPPYNECGDNGTFRLHYGRNYTHDACLETCVDRTIAAMCHCYRQEYTEYYTKNELESLETCTNKSKEVKCKLKYIKLFEKGALKCGCAQGCNATEYQVEYSVNKWPNYALWYSLTDAICNRDTESAQEACWHLRENGIEKQRVMNLLEKNFMKVAIYYKDLNFETVTEQAAYDRTQFLSDFGGTIGLWVGASFITAVEVIDLMFQLIVWCCKRHEYKQRAEKQNSTKSKTSNFDQLSTGDKRSLGSGGSQGRPNRDWTDFYNTSKYGVNSRRPTDYFRRY